MSIGFSLWVAVNTARSHPCSFPHFHIHPVSFEGLHLSKNVVNCSCTTVRKASTARRWGTRFFQSCDCYNAVGVSHQTQQILKLGNAVFKVESWYPSLARMSVGLILALTTWKEGQSGDKCVFFRVTWLGTHRFYSSSLL